MAKYCVALYKLGKEVMNDVVKKCINIFKNGAKDLLKAVYSDAPVDAEIQAVLDKVGAKIKKEVKDKIKAALPKKSPLNDALKNYENLNKLYAKLKTVLNSDNPKLADISKTVNNFVEASDKVLNSLSSSITLNHLSDPLTEPFYNDDYTEVTIPSGLFGSFESTVEKVYCGEWKVPVVINGNSLNNTIIGGSAKNTIYGFNGDDSLVGGKNNDILYGGAGNDTLWGGTGNDILYGGAGNDILYGGSGNDIFVFKPGEGTDIIKDFQSGDMLKILKKNGQEGTFSKATFSENTLTLAIYGGGKVLLEGVSAGDRININGTFKTISDNTLK